MKRLLSALLLTQTQSYSCLHEVMSKRYALFVRMLVMSAPLLIAGTLIASFALASVTDKNLARCIDDAMTNDNVTQANELKRLKCHSKDISDLSGLEHYTGLEYLSLFANDIRHADLTQLSKLTYLNLAKNKLETLNIAGLASLDTLFLFKNNLEGLDLSGLSNLSKMRVMENKLQTLDISALLSLEEAYLWDNQLEDLDITGLDNLKFLDVKQNPMPDELYDFFDEQSGITISHDGNADDWK